MRNESYRQVSLIEDDSLLELEKKINKRMQELAGCSPELDVDVKARYAVITYTSYRDIAETIKDEYNKKGAGFHAPSAHSWRSTATREKRDTHAPTARLDSQGLILMHVRTFTNGSMKGRLFPKQYRKGVKNGRRG